MQKETTPLLLVCTSHLDPDVEHDDMFHELYEDDIIVCPRFVLDGLRFSNLLKMKFV